MMNLTHFARARQQELAIWSDDLRYRIRNHGEVVGNATGVEDLPALARQRWRDTADAPFHVLYVGHPSNWEEHNLPGDPGASGIVSTYWLRDGGFTESAGGALVRRDEVGPAIQAHIASLQTSRPVHLVIAYLSGSHVRPEHVRDWARLGVVSAAFHLDDRLYFRGRRVGGLHVGPADTAPAFDLNLTNVRRSLTKYAAVGARAMFWPEAANPAAFRPLGLPRTHDLSFLGGRYGPRGEVVERLERDGLSVLARGPGWPEGPVENALVPEVMNRGRVVLGFSGIGRSMRATCLKGRDFEAPMCGAAYLTSWNPELRLVYRVGIEIETWRTYRELLSTLRRMLADEAGLERMRKAVLARARSEHTWAHRIEAIAKVLGHPWKAPVVGA